MPITFFPVMLPFQPGEESGVKQASMSICAAASTPRNAVAVAAAFAPVIARRRYQQPIRHIHYERAQVGIAGEIIHEPYAYVLGQTNHVTSTVLPRRLDHASISQLRLLVTGLYAGGADALIIDAAQLTFLDSSALTGLSTLSRIAAQSTGLEIHFFRPSMPIRKVFEIVGLDRILGIHDTLEKALAAVPSTPRVWQRDA